MKKTLAILLLALMVFNLTGYHLLFTYLQGRAEVTMVEKLDKNAYSHNNLVEIKVALHLPYTANNKGFERYDGSIELNGKTYSYVERKIENDTLVLHCLPNISSDNIKLASNEYGKAVNDILPAQKSQKGTNAGLLLKSLLCAGYKTHIGFYGYNTIFAVQLAAYKTVSESITVTRFAKSPEQPPDLA